MEHAVPDQILIWADAYLKGAISDEDKAKLEQWYKSLPDRDVEWDDDLVGSPEALRSAILSAIQSKIRKNAGNPSIKKKTSWYKYAAAVILLICGAAVIFYQQKDRPEEKTDDRQIVQRDVPPGAVKAMLILANGQKIILDNAQVGKLATQEGAMVFNRDGTIVYDGIATGSQPVYNTLTTGRAEQSPPLTLADGTKVWLNASSSIRFPVAFQGSSREVDITGEAYFEVSKDNERPFIVKTGASAIKVLGTHFNVMAYDNEPYTAATLLEGAISISSNGKTMKLSPGQQARVDNTDTRITLIKEADADNAIAWLHGQFPMSKTDITALMRQISRWYDVDIVYKGAPPVVSFSGALSRQVNLHYLLSALESNDVHCILEGKTVTVLGK
ncbi:MAG: FecR domain-containing protein [Chitinophagaceae bacterium]|nr:FecR domain-containing protein [Chitinophagaceae bacterium]